MAAYVAIGARRRGIVGSAILIAVGSLVKQTVALSALPIFAYLILRRRYKDAGIYAAVVTSLGGIFWTALNWASDGYYFTSAVAGNVMPMSLFRSFSLTHVFLLEPICVTAAIIIAIQFVTDSAFVRSFYCLAFTTNLLCASLLVSKVGADANYFLEATALAAVVIGLHGLAPLWTAHPGRAAVVLGAVTLALVAPIISHLGDERGRRFPFSGPEFTELAGLQPGSSVLADGEHIDLLVRAGYRPVVNDPLQFWLLAKKGTVRLASVLDALERGDVPYLVLAQPIQWHRQRPAEDSFWPPEILAAMDRRYRLVSSRGGRYVYAYSARLGA